MARVHSPREGWDGVSVGVKFRDGVAEVGPKEHPAALAYFERAGYRIERPKPAVTTPPPVPEVPEDTPRGPEAPPSRAPKVEWVDYVVDQLQALTRPDAERLTRDQLAERYTPARD